MQKKLTKRSSLHPKRTKKIKNELSTIHFMKQFGKVIESLKYGKLTEQNNLKHHFSVQQK